MQTFCLIWNAQGDFLVRGKRSDRGFDSILKGKALTKIQCRRVIDTHFTGSLPPLSESVSSYRDLLCTLLEDDWLRFKLLKVVPKTFSRKSFNKIITFVVLFKAELDEYDLNRGGASFDFV